MRSEARTLAAAALLVLAGASPVAAQAVGPGDEADRMREASLLEAAGELGGAERVLLEIVAERPSSAPALLALERILVQQRRLPELAPRVARGLESEPRSSLLNQMLLRTYSRLDRVADVEAAAAAWIAADPGIETPYREVARTWEGRGDYERARSALEAGRRAVTRDDALALELGAVYAAIGHHAAAVEEWDRAIGADGRGVNAVRRGLRSLPDGGAGVIPGLVDRLGQDPATRARLMAAVDLAVAGGLEPAAVSLGRRLGEQLRGSDRTALLLDLARRADGARLSRLAHWAYGELVQAPEVGTLPVIQARLEELARELGEAPALATAADGGGGAAGSGDTDAVVGRQAEALRIELLAAQDPDAAYDALRAFRQAHGAAPDLDRLASTVAEALLRGGGADARAEDLLAGVRGPRSALVRGRLALARGDRQEARAAFMTAAPSLPGPEATQVLSLVAGLSRVSDDGARLLARALSRPAGDEPGAGLDRVLEDVASLPRADHAPLLEFAAAMADAAGLAAEARGIRDRIVSEHPRSTEAPAALLALARSLPPENGAEARELLERLIIEYPRSALVPQARRELEQLRRAGGATDNPNAGR